MWLIDSSRETSGCPDHAAMAALCLSSHVYCSLLAQPCWPWGSPLPGCGSRGASTAAGTGVISVPACSCGCRVPSDGHCPQTRDQGRALSPADSGQGHRAGKQARSLHVPILNWGCWGSPLAHARSQLPCVPAEGGGGFAPAHELAPGRVLCSSWWCQWITANSICTALIDVP